jgi:hypothetical protein
MIIFFHFPKWAGLKADYFQSLFIGTAYNNSSIEKQLVPEYNNIPPLKFSPVCAARRFSPAPSFACSFVPSFPYSIAERLISTPQTSLPCSIIKSTST